jgi:Rrf2 family protein
LLPRCEKWSLAQAGCAALAFSPKATAPSPRCSSFPGRGAGSVASVESSRRPPVLSPRPLRPDSRQIYLVGPHRIHDAPRNVVVGRAPPTLQDVQISAKVDYGMRALLVLVAAAQPMTVEAIAANQAVPSKFLGVILNDLRRAGILVSHRGREAGYNLAWPAAHITTADVFRALDGPLAQVHGVGPEMATYHGSAEHLQEVWIAVRASLRALLENLTLEDIHRGKLPANIARLIADPDAWVAHRLG